MIRMTEQGDNLGTSTARLTSRISDRQAAFRMAGTTARAGLDPVRVGASFIRVIAAPAQSPPASVTATLHASC